MSYREDWEAVVAQKFPEGHAAGFPGYPLLGDELSSESASPSQEPWRLRLSLSSEFSEVELQALLEGVEEVCLCSQAVELQTQVGEAELFLEGVESENAWSTEQRGRDESGTTIWRRGERERVEMEISPGSQILTEVAHVRKRRGEGHLVVTSHQSAGGEAEALISDVLAYWCGAVGGAQVLEVAQQPGEGFESLWNRLCAVRLLRYEADLGCPQEPLAGAGFFSALKP